MARIAGVDLPREKRVEVGLTYIYGIGRTSAHKVLEESGVDPDRRVHQLTDEEVEIVKSHTTIGGKMLTGTSSWILQAAEEVALYHPEAWDGPAVVRGFVHGLGAFGGRRFRPDARRMARACEPGVNRP